MAQTNVQAFSGDVEISGGITQGNQVLYPQRRWEIDLTSGTTTDRFYPTYLASSSPSDVGSFWPINFKVFGESLIGSDPYNEETLIGYARGGGFSDHRAMCKVQSTRFAVSDIRFQGLWEGTSSFQNGFVIYMRGGYKYSILTDASTVVENKNIFVVGGSTYALKNSAGVDAYGTSVAISQVMNVTDFVQTGDVTATTGSLILPDSTARLGIGKTNPGSALDVVGDVAISSNLAVDTNTLFVDSVGNKVGIGTTNPNVNLDVTGTIRVTGGEFSINTNVGHIRRKIDGNGVSLTSYEDFRFYVNATGGSAEGGTNSVTFNSAGNVGIGVTNPFFPLHIVGTSGVLGAGNRRYFSHSVALNADTDLTTPDSASIYTTGSIYTGNFFLSSTGTAASSDERIKKDITDIDDGDALQTLRELKPKKYSYKDTIKRGTEPVWGFIAQEVKDTLPYATFTTNDFIPNIYELANVSGSNVITFTNFDTSTLESNANTIRITGIDDKEHEVTLTNIIDTHTIQVLEDLSSWTGSVDENGNVLTDTTTLVLSVEEYANMENKEGFIATISGYQNENVIISVDEYNSLEDKSDYQPIIENYSKTTTTYPGNNIFVYGQQVDDFLVLKKDAIFTVATAALQEIDRQLQAEKVRNDALEARILALESA